MNGMHDLGGMHGFGPVEREEDEPVFHARWEGLSFAIVQATRGLGYYNIDEFRHGIERMDPLRYLAASYYERWLASAETNLVEKRFLTREEIDARTERLGANPDATGPRVENPALLERLHAGRQRGWPLPDDESRRAFRVGDAVVVRNVHPPGHTRLPRYVRGKRGIIHACRGFQVFPDANAHGRGAKLQPVYSVHFEGRELWGDSAEPGQVLYLDLWESYLESPT